MKAEIINLEFSSQKSIITRGLSDFIAIIILLMSLFKNGKRELLKNLST